MSHITSVIFEIVTTLVVIYFVYELFLSDFFEAQIESFRQHKLTASNFDKIAKIKLVSDDPKEIEKFITDHAQFLSDVIVQLLVNRIAELKADKAIDNENIKLKNQIDASIKDK